MNVDNWQKTIPRPIIMLVYSIIFILALISTSGIINTVLPASNTPPGLGDISVKFQYFAEHKDDYDVIFLGPSTTYHGVIPKIFDESLSENAKNVKSFNFGIAAANVAEMEFYLQKILDLKPAHLKWIFLDCLVDFFVEEAPTSVKNIYWHTPFKTIENFKLILDSNFSWLIKINGFYKNTISFFYRWLGIGYFSWQQSPDILPEGIASEKLLEENGYYAMDWLKNSEEWQEIFQSNYLDSYQARLKQAKSGILEQDNKSTYPAKLYGIKLIKKMVNEVKEQEKISKNKIEPIFLIPPVLDVDIDHSAIMKAYELGYISTLFAFNNPNTFASFYEVSRRSDGRHLNNQGAEEFTRALAAKFSQHLNSSQEKLDKS
ncbi:hypothetical protein [Nodularia sphaerocarpa]|uniref:hypothetical protein n=1 Tax=Nodularia sphaerocarpa TaxID=137816 RepID=UPI001EFC03B2|nr:hypothetical protein [Nodularia sphaerocarpa]MDB9373583.1 hypothetical protein [Nodularia sphaerocarpa CS-585]MDB9378032.1 hypothetical protein [Nodularia sphaerocarpa CS-585A2]ULP74371.1 hypothetical protein BDGGKGIB_04036 [Nodularia sphaerocarpa UHCC 0038]